MTIHCEVEQHPERVFVRFWFNTLNGGSVTFEPSSWRWLRALLKENSSYTEEVVSEEEEEIRNAPNT